MMDLECDTVRAHLRRPLQCHRKGECEDYRSGCAAWQHFSSLACWRLPLRLYRLQECVDTPFDIVADGLFPDRHAFVHAPVIYRSPEQADCVVAIADVQTPQISWTLSLYRVGTVTMGTILIEQAGALRRYVFASFIGIFQPFGIGFGRVAAACEQENCRGDQSPGCNHIVALHGHESHGRTFELRNSAA